MTASTQQPEADPGLSAASTPRRRKTSFRVYCFSCGRSTEVDVAPRRIDRCDVCGGTMLVEMGDND